MTMRIPKMRPYIFSFKFTLVLKYSAKLHNIKHLILLYKETP